ncbi:MAG: hypothetical protein E7211_21590 [Clostridium lundense]|nr:hypothetical protein [Clostridium lundense]
MDTVFGKIEKDSQERMEKLKSELNSAFPRGYLRDQICVYACGSLGRLEMTESSDLDLFFISDIDSAEKRGKSSIANLDKYCFFAQLYEINRKLHYKDPSKGGEYWDFIPKPNLLDIGSREEDYNNSFTARMLLLLESKPLYNELAYQTIVKEAVDKYFGDFQDYSNGFFPLFLMNDILRYWYTLTLNYEYRRDDNDDTNKKNWKRLKLKYARLITCFSMLACLYQEKITPENVISYVKMTPFERINLLANQRAELRDVVSKICEEYEWYLELRKQGPEWWNISDHKSDAFIRADRFHDLVVHEFMRKVSEGNPALRGKADTY